MWKKQTVCPLKSNFGDRGTYEYRGVKIPIGEIAESTARHWIQEHLRFVDPLKHIVFQNEIKPCSPELTDIFSRKVMGANETSTGVGYAPLSKTERLVLATEKFLNAPSFKDAFPSASPPNILDFQSQMVFLVTSRIKTATEFFKLSIAEFEQTHRH